MAMNGKNLGDAIADLIIAPNASEEMKTKITNLWEGIGAVIVNHIQDNMEVTIPANSVVVDVKGQAEGVKNSSAIDAEIDA